jgi:hypothetical protein
VAARYHPGVIWAPFLLALALGIIVSAGLYFAYLWPQVEPDDELDNEAADQAAPATDPAASAKPAETEPETETPSPTSESSPA